MSIRGLWEIVVLCLTACSAGAAAQTVPLSISGHVRDGSTQEPISQARVELRTLSGAPVGKATTTASDGGFRLSTSVGNYLLTVEHSGYELASVPLGSDSSEVLVSLQRLHADTGGATAISAHELSAPAKAKADFEKGSALMSKTPPEYERAIHEFHHAIKEFPGYYEAYGEMSIAQFRVGDTQPAEDSLEKSITLSGGRYVKGMALMAELLNSRSRFAEAEMMARQAIAVDESSAAAHCQLARALNGLKRPAEAAVSANRALQLEPTNPVFLLVLGNIHLQQHEFGAAVHDFDAYLQKLPSGPQSDLVRAARDRAQASHQADKTRTEFPGP